MFIYNFPHEKKRNGLSNFKLTKCKYNGFYYGATVFNSNKLDIFNISLMEFTIKINCHTRNIKFENKLIF